MSKIRTRYAPSPTGYLHIGGARTALFAYLYAKHNNGTFIIRIEDTDIERNIVDGERSQIENLLWLGIDADESPLKQNPKYAPYRQSEKFNRYYQVALDLIEKGFAYKAYDSSEELEKQQQDSLEKGITSFRYNPNWLKISDVEKQKREKNHEFAIRLVSPLNQEYKWIDLVRGEISINSNDIGDWVIIKSNKIATYNFAVVVDDHDMEISHILRGEEHITNTPRQIMVYKYLNWNMPKFGHLTIITNMDGKKLSKRDTSLKQFIEDYKNDGYHPHAIFNFLTLLGYTDKQAREVMDQKQIIDNFDSSRLSKSPSKFDVEKMNWFSKQYWQKSDNQTLINALPKNNKTEEWLNVFVNIYKKSLVTTNELIEHFKLFEIIDQKEWNFDENEINVIKTFSEILNGKKFTIDNIQAAIDQTKIVLKINGKNLFLPIRKAMTQQEHGAELASCIYLYGFELINKRIKSWL